MLSSERTGNRYLPLLSTGRAVRFESGSGGPPINDLLIGIKAESIATRHEAPVWQPISTAPFESEIELAVIDSDGPHALVFPCRRVADGWVNAETEERIYVRPTHWRPWCPGA
jgi:hypothetical protein